MGKRFSCRVVRPVLQSTIVEIEADNPREAVKKALKMSKNCEASKWETQDFDPIDYAPHVQEILDHDKIRRTNPHPEKTIEKFGSRHSDQNVKYLILSANRKSLEGCVLSQPWFMETDPILQADLCQDWSETINYICENDGLDEAANCVNSLVTEHDNVIPFKPASLQQDIYRNKKQKDS